ncbi:MAG: hypothetical protein J2P28_04380 [Actinobacteria bacterium]|nr:hypothetical protein [Actinomycetota bacterium]
MTAVLPARPAALAGHRWLAVAGWTAGTAAAFACFLQLARTRPVDSDGASIALQAWDMLHGNVLLHGWWLSDVSFYTTELPEYLLVELVRPLNADVVHVAAALTYTLVLLLAALLAKGTATGRAAVARVLITVGIMLAPQLSSGVKILISSPDHIGTTAPVMAVWLILDRARQRWFVPVIATIILAWAAVADALVLFIGVLPVIGVCIIRVWRAVAVEGRPLRSQWFGIGLGAGAVLAAGIAELALLAIRAAGGFVVGPLSTHVVGGVSGLPHSLNVTAQSLLLVSGADFLNYPPTAFIWLHLAGVLAIVLGVAVAAWRFRRNLGLVDQLLLTAIAINVVAYLFSTQSTSVLTAREIVAVLPFSAVLAGRMLACRVLAVRRLPIVLLVVLAGYVAALGYGLTQPVASPQNQQLASWLAAHELRSGLAGYWESNVVTLATGEHITVRPISATRAGTRVMPYRWESRSAWYKPGQASANFVVLTRGTAEFPGFADESAVLATFGRPARVDHVGRYLVLVWNRNLLRDLG